MSSELVVKSVKLVNFRSHESYTLECNKKTSLILGPNGAGKTSVLEAIYVALRGKSFRAADAEILRRGEEFYRIELEFMNGMKTVAVFDGKKRSFLTGDKKSARLPKQRMYPVVLFLPDDLHIVDTSPTNKRAYFDRIVSGLDSGYSVILSRYDRVLRQRNKALREMSERGVRDEGVMFSWNLMLAKYGVRIRQSRVRLEELLNEQLTDVYRSIANNNDEVGVKYTLQGEMVDESKYLAELAASFEKDVCMGRTLYGAHKDNYEFIFNGVEAGGSASRGEVRSLVLAIKFIEAKLVYGVTKYRPVVLLDDVFSELDEQRQASLVTNFKENQVIITSVDGVEIEE